jgi:hypothetical protein
MTNERIDVLCANFIAMVHDNCIAQRLYVKLDDRAGRS